MAVIAMRCAICKRPIGSKHTADCPSVSSASAYVNIEPKHNKRLYVHLPNIYVAWTDWTWSYYPHRKRWCVIFAYNRSEASAKADQWFCEVYSFPCFRIPLPDYGVIKVGTVGQALVSLVKKGQYYEIHS